MKTDNAFPMVVSDATSEAHPGLTKREYFAAAIAAGYAACPNVRMDQELAGGIVRFTDLLLEALEEEKR